MSSLFSIQISVTKLMSLTITPKELYVADRHANTNRHFILFGVVCAVFFRGTIVKQKIFSPKDFIVFFNQWHAQLEENPK